MYEGGLKNLEPHGKGTIKYVNGDVYEGEFKQGMKHGLGVYTSSGKVSGSLGGGGGAGNAYKYTG